MYLLNNIPDFVLNFFFICPYKNVYLFIEFLYRHISTYLFYAQQQKNNEGKKKAKPQNEINFFFMNFALRLVLVVYHNTRALVKK